MSERMSEDEIKAILDKRQAIITNSHFVYTKPEGHGDHGAEYVNKDALYPDTSAVLQVCHEMAYRMIGLMNEHHIIAVVGPEKGAIILSTWVAFQMTSLYGTYVVNQVPGHNIFSVYAEKEGNGGFIIRRGYDKLIKKELGKVVVVEDILNSGGTVEATLEAIRKAGGDPIAVSAVCNRGGVTAEQLKVPHLFSLLTLDMKKYPESECPLCAQGIPVRTDLGHGAEFLKKREAVAHGPSSGPDSD